MTPGMSRTQASISASGRDLAAGEHVVADRDLGEVPRFDDALVDALEPPAQDHRARTARERRHPRLRERHAARAHQQARAGVVRRARRRRARAPARRPSSPCRDRRRRACRRRCGACRSACARMSMASSDHKCRAASALPARLTPSGPGNISGKMVSTLARHMAHRGSVSGSPGGDDSCSKHRGIDHDPPRRRYRPRHRRFGERQHHRRIALCRLHLDQIAGAEIVDRDDAAERVPSASTAASPIRSAW